MIACINNVSGVTDNFLKQFLPVICVLLGIGVSEVIGYFRRYRKRKESGQGFIMQIVSARSIIKEQVSNIEAYIADILSKTPSGHSIEVLSLVDFKRISVFDRLLVYKFFKRICRDKTEAMDIVDKLYISIDAIGLNMNRILKEFEEMIDRKLVLGEEINSRLLLIRNKIGEWRISQENFEQDVSTKDNFYGYLIKTALPVIADNSYTITELNEKLFHPLIDKCIDNKGNNLADSLRILSIECSDIIYKINWDRIHTAKYYISPCLKSMKSHYELINELTTRFNLLKYQ